MRTEIFERIHSAAGFIAALDQSGGSTPKALKLYGIDESRYTNEQEMFRLIHAMRTRIITSPVFNSERILAVILFEETMNSKIDSLGTAEYLWKIKRIPSFLKIDNGLAELAQGVQLMRDIPQLQERIDSALNHGVIGTKMRSVIKLADNDGITNCLNQQFDIARQVSRAGLIPIIEPEIDIASPQKREAEELLLHGLEERISLLEKDVKIVLKLTLPENANLYKDLLAKPNVLRIAALSGGYSREVANKKLRENSGVIASFSRALTEGLTESASGEDFNKMLDQSIESIFQASRK